MLKIVEISRHYERRKQQTPQGDEARAAIARLPKDQRIAFDAIIADGHQPGSPEFNKIFWATGGENADATLEARQGKMRQRRQGLPAKPNGAVRPRGTFRALTRDPRYRINRWGEVVGPMGKTLVWSWDLMTGVPSVKVGGKARSILSLLQDAEFQRRKESRAAPKPAPTTNNLFERAAEDPEATPPPPGYNSWEEARAEDPEQYEISE
jgi:hypothetical protein